jgi:hypothetical protein
VIRIEAGMPTTRFCALGGVGRHVSPTGNQHDAVAAVELALAEAQRLAGRPLHELASRDADGSVMPLVRIVSLLMPSDGRPACPAVVGAVNDQVRGKSIDLARTYAEVRQGRGPSDLWLWHKGWSARRASSG